MKVGFLLEFFYIKNENVPTYLFVKQNGVQLPKNCLKIMNV